MMPWQVTDPDGQVHSFERQPENTKAVFVPATTTCSTCLDGVFSQRELAVYGHRTIGTCNSGGPKPGDGCSDVGPDETCGRWRADKKKA